MHLLRTQSRTIDEAEGAVDLGQTPADVLCLSFSDSDLGALAAGAAARSGGHSLRLASLAQLRHPYSVDLYLDGPVARAKFVLVRLLGGLDYWRYGVDELARAARQQGFALAVVPGCHSEDPRLDAASTLPVADLRRIWRWFAEGGEANMASLFGWIDTRLGTPTPWREPQPLPAAGRFEAACRVGERESGHAFVVFYRSLLLSGDCAPVDGAGGGPGGARPRRHRPLRHQPEGRGLARDPGAGDRRRAAGRGPQHHRLLRAARWRAGRARRGGRARPPGDPGRGERGAMARQPARARPRRSRDERGPSRAGRAHRHGGGLGQGGEPAQRRARVHPPRPPADRLARRLRRRPRRALGASAPRAPGRAAGRLRAVRLPRSRRSGGLRRRPRHAGEPRRHRRSLARRRLRGRTRCPRPRR